MQKEHYVKLGNIMRIIWLGQLILKIQDIWEKININLIDHFYYTGHLKNLG